MTPEEIETLAEHVADSLWLSAYADAVDRAIEDGHDGARGLHPGAGGEWADTDYRPVPPRYLECARRVLAQLPAHTLTAGRSAWRDLSREDDERLGHVMAMEILGHGVGLEDDLPTYAVRGPVTMIAQYDSVKRLSNALPCLDPSCELHAEYNPETGKVE